MNSIWIQRHVWKVLYIQSVPELVRPVTDYPPHSVSGVISGVTSGFISGVISGVISGRPTFRHAPSFGLRRAGRGGSPLDSSLE